MAEQSKTHSATVTEELEKWTELSKEFTANIKDAEDITKIETDGLLDGKADVTSIITPSGATPTVTLTDNTESRRGAVTALTLTLPSDTSGDYISSVIFTANSPTPLVYPDNITMIGTDCIDGVFAPVSGKRYTVIVAYDGAGLVGTVGGYAI